MMGDALDLYGFTEGVEAGGLVPLAPDSGATPPPDSLLGGLGIALTHIGRGRAVAGMTVGREHLNQRGLVQGGAIVALADATAGWASYSSLEHGRFTTLDLTVSFLRAAREGDRLVATASPVRLGRRVQVFDVLVEDALVEEAEDGKVSEPEAPATAADAAQGRVLARITCTQLVLDPRAVPARAAVQDPGAVGGSAGVQGPTGIRGPGVAQEPTSVQGPTAAQESAGVQRPTAAQESAGVQEPEGVRDSRAPRSVEA